MKNKFKIISYIKYPDGTYNAPGGFCLQKNDFTKIVQYYNILTKKYCDIHNYKYQFREITDDDLLDIKQALVHEWCLTDGSDNQYNNTTDIIVLYKLKYLKEVLERNEDEYVVFFDVDAIPSNPNISLESLIDDKHEFFVPPGNKYADYITATDKFIPALIDIVNNKNNLLQIFCTDPTKLVAKIENEYNINLLARFQQFVKIFAGFNEGLIIIKNTEKMKKLLALCCNNYQISIHRNFNSGADRAFAILFSFIKIFLFFISIYAISQYGSPSWDGSI